MKRTLKRELKVLEIVKRETIETTYRPGRKSTRWRMGAIFGRGFLGKILQKVTLFVNGCTFLSGVSISVVSMGDGYREGDKGASALCVITLWRYHENDRGVELDVEPAALCWSKLIERNFWLI